MGGGGFPPGYVLNLIASEFFLIPCRDPGAVLTVCMPEPVLDPGEELRRVFTTFVLPWAEKVIEIKLANSQNRMGTVLSLEFACFQGYTVGTIAQLLD